MKPHAVSRLWLFAGCAMVLSIAASHPARAQSIDPTTTYNPDNTEADSFNRGDNVSVRERPRPDYQAAGVHLGGFMIYPKVTTSVGYDDNIFALQNNKVGDTIFTISPEVDFQSTWSRNALNGYIRASQDLYTKYTSENTTQYGAGLSGKYEFGNASSGEAILTAGLDYGHYALPRSAENSGAELSKHPIEYDYEDADAELADTFNRLRLSARVDYQNYDYQNGVTPDGDLVFEQGLNHYVTTLTSKAEYALSPETAVFVSGAYNWHLYELGIPAISYNSDSQGFNIAGGLNFDITHLVRGEVQLGYLDQEYVSPLFPSIRGLSAKGQIEWFPTQLTTVTATALRSVGDSGIIHAAGFLNTTGGLQIDHELLRNLILTANTSYTENQYSGIDRTDDIWGAGASANWLITRWVGLTLAYTYANQRSTGVDRGLTFDDNRVTLSAVFQR